jgi:hypothetical protein
MLAMTDEAAVSEPDAKTAETLRKKRARQNSMPGSGPIRHLWHNYQAAKGC